MDSSDQFGNAMGGNPGDGIPQSQAQTMMGGQVPPSTPGYSSIPQNTPANTPMPQNQQPTAGSSYPTTPMAGSITQFASPAMQQQQQQQTPMYPQSSSPYNLNPPPSQPSVGLGSAGNGNLSYSQRAAMLQQQQQQPVYNPQPSPGGLYPQSQQAALMAPQVPKPPVASGMSYAQRSQQATVQQQPVMTSQPPHQQQQQVQQQHHQPVYQPQQPGMVPTQQQMTPNSSNQYNGMPQQQPGVSNQYSGMVAQQQPTVGGSFAARSAMAHSAVVETQQQQQQQQQLVPNQYTGMSPHTPNMAAPASGSYAERSAAMANSTMTPGIQPVANQYNGMSPQMAPSGSYADRSAAMAQSTVVSPTVGGGVQQPSTMMQPNTMLPPTAGQPNQSQIQTPQMQQRSMWEDPPQVVAQQQRLLTDATRKVQEHAYYMKQAMERNDLPAVLDRAASMVGELGEHAHSHHNHRVHPPAPGATGSTTALSPKYYYELHMRALEELPTLEDYLLAIAQGGSPATMGQAAGGPTNADSMTSPPILPPAGMNGSARPNITYTMKELYDCVQYSPNVLSRLYLQICAASALIRSGEVGARWVMKDLIEAVKCVQNPVRGLFLRHYLLQAFRDKLPDEPIPLDEVGPPMTASYTPPVPVPSEEQQEEKQGEEGNDATPNPVIAADVTSFEKGTVKDSYQFVLANFIEMNKLWVRIQHLPGDARSKDVRRRRERERSELRILIGTNFVRLSALDSVTSSIYGQVILPTVLDHIVICADPLAQAYLIDCIVQVFPDEYHIETMPILLSVCPKLRDKVNIRTILQALMDRLANYLADEELLDEKDSNQVKRKLAEDSFQMFDECVQNVYNARGPKLQAKEVIRLQTALLAFSKKCFSGNREQVVTCLNHCVVALQQASANQALMQDYLGQNMPQQPPPRTQLEEVATKELEKLLSIPLDEMGLGVLTLDHYSDLISFLPWANRLQVALTMLDAISKKGTPPESIKELEELFVVIAPVLRNEHDLSQNAAPTVESSIGQTAGLMAGLGVGPTPQQQPVYQYQDQSFQQDDGIDTSPVSKLIHLLDHDNTDVLYEMLVVARNHLNSGRPARTNTAYSALVFASLKLAKQILDEELGESVSVKEKLKVGESEEPVTEEESKSSDEKTEEAKTEPASEEKPTLEEKVATPKSISCRKVLIFTQQTIANLSKSKPENGIKLYLEAALTADNFGKRGSGKEAFGSIAYEFISQSFSLYEENSADSKLQSRCVVAIIGTLLACRSLGKEDYEGLIMKTAQYAAKMLKKPDQCEMVALCSHLFYVVGEDDCVVYSNPQRGLECLQRALKLADACTSSNPANVRLFVELLDHYLFFFEKKNPKVTGNYITGLVALIKEHMDNLGQVGEAKEHFFQIVRHIKGMKEKSEAMELFADIDVSSVIT